MKRSRHPFVKTPTAAAPAGLLSACAVGPQYQRPDVPLSEHFRNAPAPTCHLRCHMVAGI